MLTRISLIIVILTGIGAIVFGQLNVKEKIAQALDARDEYHTNWKDEERLRIQREQELAEVREELEATRQELEAARNEIQQKNAEIASLNTELERTRFALDNTRAELAAASAELNRYTSLGLTVEDIRDIIDRLRQSTEQIAQLEGAVAQRDDQIRGLQSRIADLIGTNYDEVVILPAGLKGKVETVDPKWEFVIVSVGKNQGALRNGKMLVSRDGKLIAKIRLVNVLDDHSVANVIPDYELGDVLEGDDVIY